MTRLYAALVGMLLERQTWALELFLATHALAWGLWVLAPWDAFAVLPSAYVLLYQLPEWAWGGIFTVHGVGHLYALRVRDVGMCRRAALSLNLLWAIVFVNYLVTIPFSVAPPTYGMLVLATAAVHRRLTWRFA